MMVGGVLADRVLYRGFWDIQGVQRISRGFQGVPRISRGCQGYPGGSREMQGVTGISRGCRDIQGVLNISRGFQGYPGGFKYIQGFPGISKSVAVQELNKSQDELNPYVLDRSFYTLRTRKLWNRKTA